MKKLFLFILFIFFLDGCNKNNITDNLKEGYATNFIVENDYKTFKEIFESNQLSNIELLFSWLEDFNKEEDSGCGIKGWNKWDTFSYNEGLCTERYEKTHEISDGDCRITAFSLLQNLLKIEKSKSEYGSYLMFDIDVLDNNTNYKKISDDRARFITLFDEIEVKKGELKKLNQVYVKKWDDYGIKINSEKVSLISVLMYDEDFKTLFVGHAGVLIDLGDKYMFVEKIAFEQPYQFTILKSPSQLKEIFKKRSSYFGDDIGPFVYQNNKLLFEY